MSNFIEEFKKGQKGGNKGLPFGPGLENLTKAINGVQRRRNYGIGASPKVGKTTLVDYAFVLNPYLQYIESLKTDKSLNIEWIYFSFEANIIDKQFNYATFFLHYDFNIYKIPLSEGVKYRGKDYVVLSPDYLLGRLLDDNDNIIKVNDEIKEKLRIVYENRIVPLFGKFDKTGKQIKKGMITFIREKDNPTGLYYYILSHAEKNGKFKKKKYGSKERIISYTPNDPNKFTIVITDHVRSLLPERGFTKKETVDKYIQYTEDLRDWTDYTFVHVVHMNRNLASTETLKQFKDMIYPTAESVKDTGNISESVDYMLTMFNPNDDRYNLNQHFGMRIKDRFGNPLYPHIRTIHLVESRHCIYPQHFKTCMNGSVKTFKPFKEKSKTKKEKL